MAKILKVAQPTEQAAADALPEEAPRDPLPEFKPSLFLLREAAVNDWFVTAPKGLEPQDLEDGAPWLLVAQQLHDFDVVRVVGHNREWYAEVFITHATANTVDAKTLRVVQLGAAPAVPTSVQRLPTGYDIRLGTFDQGLCVYRQRGPDGPWELIEHGGNQSFWNFERCLAWTVELAAKTSSPTAS